MAWGGRERCKMAAAYQPAHVIDRRWLPLTRPIKCNQTAGEFRTPSALTHRRKWLQRRRAVCHRSRIENPVPIPLPPPNSRSTHAQLTLTQWRRGWDQHRDNKDRKWYWADNWCRWVGNEATVVSVSHFGFTFWHITWFDHVLGAGRVSSFCAINRP